MSSQEATHAQPVKRSMRILAKVGGAQLEEPAARASLCDSVARARAAGHEVVLVHGGGNQIRSYVRALRLDERYHAGLRVTDAATADVVLMVLCGLVNKELVHALQSAGVPACGMSGADGATFHARKLVVEAVHSADPGQSVSGVSSGGNRASSETVDLGYVGHIADVDGRLVETLLGQGYVPVIATAAPLAADDTASADHFYNVNADMAAGPLARALDCDALVFLTDVEGVLDGDRARIATLTPERCAKLRAGGVVHGGMIPKTDAALAALAQNPDALVKIAPAKGEDCLLRALDVATGTRFVNDIDDAEEA
jgi:acetylglutamate kinase